MIDVMVSSTVNDLLEDRTVVENTLRALTIVNVVGAKPFLQPAPSLSPYLATIEMAETCHLYMLILGGRYGEEVRTGKSATELEFDAAFQVDPTKVVVFKKRIADVEDKQRTLISKIGNYSKGYWITAYTSSEELAELTQASFVNWLVLRTAVGRRIDFFDHFLRLVVQRTPAPGVKPTYEVQSDLIQLSYDVFGRLHKIEFSKESIFSDFWGCIERLDAAFASWRG